MVLYMLIANVEGLRQFAETSFQKVGLNEKNAALASDVLIEADLRGVHSHGMHNLPRWARGFLKGHLTTNVTCPIVTDGDTITAVILDRLFILR
jgi:LDH2 family malate/lactate/ureidoglycolate dehydrogenase